MQRSYDTSQFLEVSKEMVDAVKGIPIPLYLSKAVPELTTALDGVDLDILGKLEANPEAQPICNCPVHQEKSASFRWYEKTNTCSCFGCSAGGDIINLHRKIMLENEEETVSFPEAVYYLYNRFISENSSFKAVEVKEADSKEEQLIFEHIVCKRASPEQFGMVEDLHLLIRLGKISGSQAVAYFQNST